MMNETDALNWDSEIDSDGGEYTVAPAGDYDFEVVDLEQTRYTPPADGSGKIPACPQAIVKIRVRTVDGEEVDIRHNLFLCSKTVGMIGEFFIGIGQKKRKQKFVPDWSRVVGTRGRCKVGVRKWTGKDGEQKQGNEVKKFYDPPAGQSTSQATPTQPHVPPALPNDDVPF
jgi:hypothetical protein